MGAGKEGGSDFTGVTVEAWTSFNRWERPGTFEAKLTIRLHTVNNLACLAWAQQLGLPSFLGPGHTVVDFGCGFLSFFLSDPGKPGVR